jgi:predicted esterase
MEYRLKISDSKVTPSKLPQSFIRVLDRNDPGSILRVTKDTPPSLRRKYILVLSGKEDSVVPWSVCAKFITHLQSSMTTALTVKLYDGIGHTFTATMAHDFKQWFIQFI